MTRRSLDFNKAFPNGTYIFNKLGLQIDPKSKEGQIITDQLFKQKKIKKANKIQKKKFEEIVQRDIDGDGQIG